MVERCLFNFQAVQTSVSASAPEMQKSRAAELLPVSDVDMSGSWKSHRVRLRVPLWLCSAGRARSDKGSACCLQDRQGAVWDLLGTGGVGDDSLQLAPLPRHQSYTERGGLIQLTLVCLVLDKREGGTTQTREGGEGTL